MTLRVSAGDSAPVSVDVGDTVVFIGLYLVVLAGTFFFAVTFFAALAGEAASSERTAEAARNSRRFNRLSEMRWVPLNQGGKNKRAVYRTRLGSGKIIAPRRRNRRGATVRRVAA